MATDPNPGKFPILSFVLSRLHPNPNPNPNPAPDLEQPPLPASDLELVTRLPRLNHPEVLASMASAVDDVARTRSILRSLGERPDHETLDAALTRLSDLEAAPVDADRKSMVEREKSAYRAVVQLDEMHEAYEKLLREAEERLEMIYGERGLGVEVEEEDIVVMDEEVERILRETQDGKGKVLECVDLSGRQLRFLPEAFGRMRDLIALDLSNNQIEVLPDAIAGLEHVEQLRLASNILTHLPDSIGLLFNLRILNVSGNKLKALPDSISNCRSLVELDVSYNSITYLPTTIGYGLGNVQKLMIQLNKLRSLPTSICEMGSLRYLDAHFNELHGLPQEFGKLISLEVVDLSRNFADLTELPISFGELVNLRELDLSNNQIHALPDSFGLLENLVKLSLDQNPMVIPPPEVVRQGVKSVLEFMSKRMVEILEEEEHKKLLEAAAAAQTPTGWLTRSTSMLTSWASNVSENVSDYLGVGSKSFKDPYLERQL